MLESVIAEHAVNHVEILSYQVDVHRLCGIIHTCTTLDNDWLELGLRHYTLCITNQMVEVALQYQNCCNISED